MNRRGRLRAGAAALLFLSALASWTEVDNRLGESLIPDDQQMKIKVDTVYGIDTYLAKTDSFPSERLSYMYLGSAVDPVFGRTAASASSQYVLSYYSSSYDDGDIFGTAPVFDSLVLLFTLDSSYLGDTTKTQKFNVYELVNDLDDSVYYSNFDQSTVLGDQPLFDFELTGVPTSQRRVRLEGPAVAEFARKLMDTTGGAYTSDSLFYDRFKGFGFVPDPSSPEDACVYRIGYSSMEMMLYLHNYIDESATTRRDTVSVYYSFANGSTIYNNNSVSTIRHDYTETSMEHINDTLSGSPVAQLGYVQSLGGVSTYVRFTDRFVDELLAKVEEPYNSMVINRADLVWEIDDPTAGIFDRAPQRLGSYAGYSVSFPGIPDYNYVYESSASITLQYGGNLNRTHGNYATDISSFLQKLVNSPSEAPRTMMLGPAYDELYDFKQVVLKTGVSDPPLRVILTYTLIK